MSKRELRRLWFRSREGPRVRLRTWLMPVLTLAVIITQLLAPYRGWRILWVGLGGVFVLSWLWTLSLARGVKVTRQMRFGWAQVGDRLVERFTIHNKGWAPAVWAEILDHSSLPEYAVSRGTAIRGRDVIRWHTEAVCRRRGLFTLGPTSLNSGDPFGIFSVQLAFPASMPLLVLPPVVPLPSIRVAPGGRSGEARPRANILDRTVSAAAVREYAHGDSQRWIHWRTTARRDDLYVRQFDSTPAGDWWILLDMESRVQVGQGYETTDEHGVILAASLADRGVRLRRAVGLVAEGEELVWMTPEEGDGQRWEILRSLALVNRGERPLAEMLSRVGNSLGRNASLVIITPSTETAWVEALVPLIRQGAVPTVLLLEPESFRVDGLDDDAAYGGSGFYGVSRGRGSGGGSGETAIRGESYLSNYPDDDGGLSGLGHPMDAVETALQNLGITYYEIGKDILDRPEARPGRQGQWEWRVSGTGKAIAVKRDDQGQRVEWRTLA